MGLTNISLCRRCGVEEGTSAYVLSECEVLASLRLAHFGSFSLVPEDVRSLSLGAIWNVSKEPGSHYLARLWGTKDPSKSLVASGPKGLDSNQ
jgi:hypothetical protein